MKLSRPFSWERLLSEPEEPKKTSGKESVNDLLGRLLQSFLKPKNKDADRQKLKKNAERMELLCKLLGEENFFLDDYKRTFLVGSIREYLEDGGKSVYAAAIIAFIKSYKEKK